MSIIQFLRILWARRSLVLAAVVSCVIGAFIVTLIIPPRYEAQTRVMMDLVKPDPVTGQILGQFARAYTSTQTELIKDYQVAGRVVDQLGWMNDLVVLEEYQRRGRGDDRDLRRWLAQRVIDGTEAKWIEGSNILEITYRSNSPEGARVVADALREAYISTSLEGRRESAKRTADWYSAQAEKAKAALEAAEKAKTAYERENGVVLADGKIDIDSARLAALAGAGGGTPLIAPMASAPSASAMQLAQLDAAIGQAAQTLGPNHPNLVAMRQQRSVLAGQVAQERSAANSAANAAASAMRAGAGMLEAQKSKVIAQRDKLDHLRQLQAEVDLRREQFTKAAARTAELRQEAEIGETGLTTMASAVTPQKAVFPNMPLILGGSFVFGLGFGVLMALLTELLGRRVRGVEDMRAAIPAPVLAVVSVPVRNSPAAPSLQARWPKLNRKAARR